MPDDAAAWSHPDKPTYPPAALTLLQRLASGGGKLSTTIVSMGLLDANEYLMQAFVCLVAATHPGLHELVLCADTSQAPLLPSAFASGFGQLQVLDLNLGEHEFQFSFE